MVYFRGAPNWHKRQWDSDSHFGNGPAWIRLKSPDLVLSIEYEKQGDRVVVQEQPVDLSKANVFLVSPVAESGAIPKVEALGWVSLDMPDDATPPLVILERNPRFRRLVFGDEK
jgi:hypothetical protein